MKFSLRLNNDIATAELVEIAMAAEDAGFDQLWVSNDLMLRSSPVLLGYLAACTSTLGLGSGILNARSVHVSELAMMAATLQEVSGGRFHLGIGAGAEEFLRWVGLSYEQPLAHTRRTLEELRALLTGGTPDGWHEAAFLRFDSQPAPLYLGAMGPKMLGLAGELADGALPLLYPPEHFATAYGQVAEGARANGRDVADLDVAACVWCSIDDDPAVARRALAEKIAYYGGSFSPYLLRRAGIDPQEFAPIQDLVNRGRLAEATDLVTPTMLSLGIAGGVDDVIERCRGLVAAGARHLSFGPPLGNDVLDAVDLLGRHVLPAFS